MQLKFNKNRLKTVLTICIVTVSVVLLLGSVLYWAGFRVNITPSLPVGIWRINPNFDKIKKGDIVIFSPTKKIAALGIQREYLVKKPGNKHNCINLMKQVYGLPGDQISFPENFIQVNNTPINFKRLKVDSKGRPMPQIPAGIVPPKTIFVLTQSALSFDSRYYGPIPLKNVYGTARPILIW